MHQVECALVRGPAGRPARERAVAHGDLAGHRVPEGEDDAVADLEPAQRGLVFQLEGACLMGPPDLDSAGTRIDANDLAQ